MCLIVGGVAGGASCAARLRRMDEHAEIFVFERSGDVSFANCGLPYYLGGAIADRRQLLLATPERFRDFFNIEVRTRHEVRRIDRAEPDHRGAKPSDGRRRRRAIRRPGARPGRRAAAAAAAGHRPARHFRRAQPGRHRRNPRVDRPPPASIGPWWSAAGYIGLEMAENLSRRGITVTLLELADQVMPPVDAEMVEPIHQELQRQGVDLRLGNAVAAFEPGPQDTITVVAQHDERFTADMVILAVGVRPDTQLARAGRPGDRPDRRHSR